MILNNTVLRDIDPIENYILLERYFNSGSPSGFTQINNVSEKYSSFSINKSFKLPINYLKKEKSYINRRTSKTF